MDARPNTRPVDRERKPAPPQPPRGAKQIVIPMTRTQYDEIWHDPRRIRAFVDGLGPARPRSCSPPDSTAAIASTASAARPASSPA